MAPLFQQPFLTGGFPSMNRVVGPPPHWQELGRTTLTSTGDNIDVSFTAKPYIMILGHGIPSGVLQWELGFGTSGSFDSGNNCATRISRNGTELTRTSQDTVESEHDLNADQFSVCNIINNSDNEKICIGHEVTNNGNGVTNVPTRIEIAGKYTVTTAQINFLRLGNAGSGDYASDSQLVVLGYDPADTTGTNSWEELASVELSSAGDAIDSGTFTAKKYLMVQTHCIASGTISTNIRFNGDTGVKYAWRSQREGGTDDTQASDTSIQTGDDPVDSFHTYFIVNKSNKEKLMQGDKIDLSAAGEGTAPNRREQVGKWINSTDQINEIKFINAGTGDFASGSQIKVWGFD